MPCLACDVTIGTKVQVNAGAATNGLDFALSRGGRIGGTVTRAKGAPVALATVRFYDAAGRPVSTVSTGFTGAYLSQGLPAGLYYVAASRARRANRRALRRRSVLSGLQPDRRAPVTVTTGVTTGGIDILLESGGRISGRVSDAATGDPVFEVSCVSTTRSGARARGLRRRARGLPGERPAPGDVFRRRRGRRAGLSAPALRRPALRGVRADEWGADRRDVAAAGERDRLRPPPRRAY